MDTQLLDAIRIIMKEELKPVYTKLQEHDDQFVQMHEEFKRINTRLKAMDYKLVEQDTKLDAMSKAWQIQKVHREELDDHEVRIQKIEHRIPVAS